MAITCSGKSFSKNPGWWMKMGDRHDGLVILDDKGKSHMSVHSPKNALPEEEEWVGELEYLRKIAAKSVNLLEKQNIKSLRKLETAIYMWARSGLELELE